LTTLTLKHSGGSLGPLEATIDTRGSALRALQVGTHSIIPDYAGEDAPLNAGVLMFPWTGRIPDGAWVDGDTALVLPITDTATQSALHGLLATTQAQILEHAADRVTLVLELLPSLGYPYHLSVTTVFSLDEGGMRVRNHVTNLGDATAPFALGHHPYFVLPQSSFDGVSLRAQLSHRALSDERLITSGEVAAEPPLEGLDSEDLERGIDLTYRLAPSGEDATTFVLHTGEWVIEGFQDHQWPWLHVFTHSAFPSTRGEVAVIALEPHTGLPNSLNLPGSYSRVAAGETWAGEWGFKVRKP
jgi:aldose 1-epimerase